MRNNMKVAQKSGDIFEGHIYSITNHEQWFQKILLDFGESNESCGN